MASQDWFDKDFYKVLGVSKDASDAELAAKAADGIAKLRQYAADPFVPDLAKGTTLHLILFQFRGSELVRLEEIAR